MVFILQYRKKSDLIVATSDFYVVQYNLIFVDFKTNIYKITLLQYISHF